MVSYSNVYLRLAAVYWKLRFTLQNRFLFTNVRATNYVRQSLVLACWPKFGQFTSGCVLHREHDSQLVENIPCDIFSNIFFLREKLTQLTYSQKRKTIISDLWPKYIFFTLFFLVKNTVCRQKKIVTMIMILNTINYNVKE